MRLALGTAQFGSLYGVANTNGQVSQGGAKEILKYCKAVGIDMLDTAIAYGESEQRLGEIGVTGFDLITKLPAIPQLCANIDEWMMREVKASISRLHIRSLYGLMLHRPEQLFEPYGEVILKSLYKLKSLGLVKKIGISVYSPEEIEAITALFDFDIIQVPFSVVDRRLVTSGWLDKLKANGTEVHTRSSFLQGLLLMPRDAIPRQFKAWDHLWNDWHNWLADNSVSSLEGCMAFSLSFSGINKVVIGVDTQGQLEQIVLSASKYVKPMPIPDISCNDIDLINPANWKML